MLLYYIRYGISKHDILRGVNDTTNSALLTGVTISDGRTPNVKGTTCFMHAQELVVVHALGLRQRTKNGESDEFVESKALRDKTKLLLSKIMDKKSKQRYDRYIKFCKDHFKSEAIKLLVPNETRVSGVFTMYQSAIRSRKLINLYCSRSTDAPLFSDLLLNDTDWIFIAETYSILQTTNLIAMTSQEDNVDSNCFSYYQVSQARHLLKTSKSYNIIDLCDHWTPETEVIKIPKVTRKREQLLPCSQKLIDRLVSEFDRYFPSPDSDQIMMMVLHPVMVWSGFKYVYDSVVLFYFY